MDDEGSEKTRALWESRIPSNFLYTTKQLAFVFANVHHHYLRTRSVGFVEKTMVDIEEVNDTIMPSDERLLDAEEIEKAASTLSRPTAKLQLQTLAKKLRKEAAALKRVEASKAKIEKKEETVEVTPASTEKTNDAPKAKETVVPKVVAAAPLPAPASSSSVKYTTIDRFSFDAGGYDGKFVSIYVPLPGIGGTPRDKISCQFTKDSFDLVANEVNGKSYRLFKDNLEKDIDVAKSKYVVKADKIVVKLAKTKSEYGSFDTWTKLSDPKRKDKKKATKDNPMSSITDLMKDMYDSGDDQMRKIIGETMLKQRNGELGKDKMGLDDFDDAME